MLLPVLSLVSWCMRAPMWQQSWFTFFFPYPPPQMSAIMAVWVPQERKSNDASRRRTPWKNTIQHPGLSPRIRPSTWTSVITEREALAAPKSTSPNPAWPCFWWEEERHRPWPLTRTEWPASEVWLYILCLRLLSAAWSNVAGVYWPLTFERLPCLRSTDNQDLKIIS